MLTKDNEQPAAAKVSEQETEAVAAPQQEEIRDPLAKIKSLEEANARLAKKLDALEKKPEKEKQPEPNDLAGRLARLEAALQEAKEAKAESERKSAEAAAKLALVAAGVDPEIADLLAPSIQADSAAEKIALISQKMRARPGAIPSPSNSSPVRSTDPEEVYRQACRDLQRKR